MILLAIIAVFILICASLFMCKEEHDERVKEEERIEKHYYLHTGKVGKDLRKLENQVP